MAAEAGPLELREFPGAGDGAALLPPRTRENATFWEGLRERRLLLPRCAECARARFPIAPVCPYCGATAHAWEPLCGRGTIHSWVRYQRSYLPEFEPLMPYVVLTVELEEGPRIYGLLRDTHSPLPIGAPVALAIERWPNGRCVAAFAARICRYPR